MTLLPDLPECELRTRTSAKWTSYSPEVIPLTVAEMDFALAAPIADALHAAIARSDTGYIGSTDRLGQAFAEFVARRWGWQVDPAAVVPVGDVSVGVVEALRLCTDPGDTVVINPPVHPPFTLWAGETHTQLAAAPLARHGDTWALDLDAVETAFRAGARAHVLCQPHNPVGRVHTRAELAALATLADRYGVTVIADEIYAPLTLPGTEFVPYLSVSPEAAATGIALWSTGKAWNIAGLKCATVVTAHPAMTKRVQCLPAETRMRTGHLGVLASIAAYEHGEPWLDAAIRTLDHRRHHLGRLLAEHLPGVGYQPPDAGYLAWLDMHALDLRPDPATALLTLARVAVTPGRSFGDRAGDHVRLNFATSTEILDEAVIRAAAAAAGRRTW